MARVLLVDDEPDIQLIGQTTLELIGGYEVLLAGTGEEALAIAAENAVDAVLLDYMLPDMDGPAVFKALRLLPRHGATPVIFVTGKSRPEEVARLTAMGAAGVIGKPFDPLTLCADVVRLAGIA